MAGSLEGECPYLRTRCSTGGRFALELGLVPDQGTGIANELILSLGNDLNNEFLGDELPAGGHGLVQLSDDTAGIRSVDRLQRLEGTVVGCHLRHLFSGVLVWRSWNVHDSPDLP